MKSEENAYWLKTTRRRLGLAQSDLSAYLTVKLRRRMNQGRIAEHEKGRRMLSAAILRVLAAFFQQVEELRKTDRHWTETLRM